MLNTILEEKESGVQPGFKADLPDAAQYEVVFIGGPIWWGTYPNLMFTLFSQYDLDGKILIPFTTNEGSGLGHTVADLKRVYPNAKVLEGFTITGHEARTPEARERVREWLAGFSYEASEATADVDAVTGATPMHKALTDEGMKCNKTVMQQVTVKRQDGSEATMQLAVQGIVDMGDGLLWSATNLGADKAWETGYHFAWGEAEPKASFTDEGFYWASTNSGAQNACVTYLPENSFGQSNYAKSTGIGVRAVKAFRAIKTHKR